LQKGAYTGARDDYGRIPLHLAAVAGRHEALKKLLEDKKVENDLIDRDGRTPLHLAAMAGHKNDLELLVGRVEHNSEVQNEHRFTPEYCTNMCCGINIKDNNQCTPLELAVIFKRENTAQVLCNIHNHNQHSDSDQMITSFVMAVMLGHIGIVQLMVLQVNEQTIKRAQRFAKKL
jgi:ankyrin repeat protein